MNWDQVEGKFDQYKGKIREKWGKLTDNDVTTLKGKRDKLSGVIQEKYGLKKEKAEKEIDEFLAKLRN